MNTSEASASLFTTAGNGARAGFVSQAKAPELAKQRSSRTAVTQSARGGQGEAGSALNEGEGMPAMLEYFHA